MKAMLLLAALAGISAAKALPEIQLQAFAKQLSGPVFMVPYQSGDRAFLIGEQAGLISFLSEKGGTRGEAFLDLRSRLDWVREGFDERGLLGFALHPEFENNRRFYLYFGTPLADGAPEGFDHTMRLSEFQTSADGSKADPDSERVLLEIHEPQWNHNSGSIAFGPDGHLYICVGDGGAANDLADGHAEGGNGQSLDTLLGKILRIDVDADEGYAIPADNPLVGKPGKDEIFAWGVRNPWGLTVDGDRMIFADVGQNRFEEVNVIRSGANYGWPRFEGFAPFDQQSPGESITLDASRATSPGDTVHPVIAYPHNVGFGEFPAMGISITGGHVYRGSAIKGLQGRYLYADWAMSWAGPKYGLFVAETSDEGEWASKLLPGGGAPGEKDAWITGFAKDRDGEIYVLSNDSNTPRGKDGRIWKIVPGE
ncbi:PQQ-dependent sugar dehydrogenase [Haloferula sp. A504]|uniref:PQQ-dependent sugar dehydrogenase n=1 Tax=Haloferula sp. A504 TaxID=3373601 RepID=UPI0031C37149|nr:PQQ-dependent sugar dehydrogenase [Verrucomicrobiaceae bacterium E54]